MLPELIQSNTGTTVAVAVPERYEKKIGQDSAHATNSAPVVTAFAAILPSARLPSPAITDASSGRKTRSEERRVGKECFRTLRSRWSPEHYKTHKQDKTRSHQTKN